MKSLDGILTSDRTMKEILTSARILLSEESRWAVGAPALKADCSFARPMDSDAVAWGLVGACAFASNDLGICPPALLRYLDHIVEEYTEGCFTQAEEFNDHIDHEGLLECLDLAIKKAE